MDRLNVTKGTSIMVGNNFDVDIMGAYNAGMQSMIINSKLTDEQNKKLEQLNYQVRQLDTLTDIMKILQLYLKIVYNLFNIRDYYNEMILFNNQKGG